MMMTFFILIQELYVTHNDDATRVVSNLEKKGAMVLF